MPELSKNPLLFDRFDPSFDLAEVKSPSIHKSKVREKKRDIRDLRRKQTATEAMAGFDKETEIYGFTKGQFSVVDLLEATLTITGPAHVTISTWTAAKVDVSTVIAFVESGICTGSRWLVDLTFQRRSPDLANRIRKTFGADAIRVGKNHAKFFLIQNESWRIICQTSMNLNFNPRFENFTIRHDPELCQFHQTIFDEIWTKQKREMADERPYEIHKHFSNDL